MRSRGEFLFPWVVAALAAIGALSGCDGSIDALPPAEETGGEPDAAAPRPPVDAGTLDAGEEPTSPVDGGDQPRPDAGEIDAGQPDAGHVDAGVRWAWEKSWPGLVFEGTAEVPVGRIDLPIPNGATIRQLELTYSVDIGQVVTGTRHQFSFTCADLNHPYRGGLFGFLFLGGKLGSYTFRNGRMGEGATEPTKISFRGTPSTLVQVRLLWNAIAGTALVEVTDEFGGVARITSTEKVEPMFVPKRITVIFGFDTINQPNPAESASIGWKYRDVVLRANP